MHWLPAMWLKRPQSSISGMEWSLIGRDGWFVKLVCPRPGRGCLGGGGSSCDSLISASCNSSFNEATISCSGALLPWSTSLADTIATLFCPLCSCTSHAFRIPWCLPGSHSPFHGALSVYVSCASTVVTLHSPI